MHLFLSLQFCGTLCFIQQRIIFVGVQVFEKVPFGQLTSQLGATHLGTLFLQLTVDDMGICLPLNPLPLVS
jgi:hypothetical protein